MIASNFASMMAASNRINLAQFGQVRAMENEMALMNRPVGLMFGAGMRDTFTRSAGNMMANRQSQIMQAMAEGQETQSRKWLSERIKSWFADFSSK